MSLCQQITAIYPALNNTLVFMDGTIVVQNDSNGNPPYIKVWNYSESEPTAAQLTSTGFTNP